MVTMIESAVNSVKRRKDGQVDSSSPFRRDISKESLSSLKIIKIETSTSIVEPFLNGKPDKRIGLSPSSSSKSPSPSSSSSSSPKPSTVITSIQVAPNFRSQCYITTYTPYRDSIRTNLINMEPPRTSSSSGTSTKSSLNEESAITTSSSSPSPISGTVSSSSSGQKSSRNGRSGSKKSGRWTFTNCRERQRQQNVNEAFQELRSKIPTQPVDKKLSKCSILTRAIEYIKLLNGILEKMDDGNENHYHHQSSGIRKRPWCDSDEMDNHQTNCKPSSRNSLLTSSSSSSLHDYESDGVGGDEPLEDEPDQADKDNSNKMHIKEDNNNNRRSFSSSRVTSINRPLETNVSITRVNSTIQSPQPFTQITDRVVLNCSPVIGSSSSPSPYHRRSFCKENLSDGSFSQDSQETIRSSTEDKIILDDVSLVSYEFESSREQSISSTVSSPSDSD